MFSRSILTHTNTHTHIIAKNLGRYQLMYTATQRYFKAVHENLAEKIVLSLHSMDYF